jgi:hypothetical protein
MIALAKDVSETIRVVPQSICRDAVLAVRNLLVEYRPVDSAAVPALVKVSCRDRDLHVRGNLAAGPDHGEAFAS